MLRNQCVSGDSFSCWVDMLRNKVSPTSKSSKINPTNHHFCPFLGGYLPEWQIFLSFFLSDFYLKTGWVCSRLCRQFAYRREDGVADRSFGLPAALNRKGLIAIRLTLFLYYPIGGSCRSRFRLSVFSFRMSCSWWMGIRSCSMVSRSRMVTMLSAKD